MNDPETQTPVETLVCEDAYCGHWLTLNFANTRADLAGHIMQDLHEGTVWTTKWPIGALGPLVAGMVLHVPHEWQAEEEAS